VWSDRAGQLVAEEKESLQGAEVAERGRNLTGEMVVHDLEDCRR